MPALLKIDSNTTGLRFAEELSLGVLPGSPVWVPLEPNSYADFGGEISTVARNPINPSRQRKKGVTVDLDASGGFNTDLTQTNLQNILQGFTFSSLRPKGEEVPTEATGTTDLFDLADTTGFFVGSLVFVTGFVNGANNGLHVVTAVVSNTTIEVLGSSLVTETPPATANIVVVGFEFAAGDLDVDDSGDFATLTTAAKDMTELGLIPGEPFFIGGDAALTFFGTAANNGIKRARSIAANALVVDKSDLPMVTEASTTETMRVWFGRVLKNENGTEVNFPILRRTYQLERTLGVPDSDNPTEVQAEYIIGAVPSELTLNLATADKLNADLAFIGIDSETIDAPTALKSGTRPAIAEADAFNTSSDFSRIRLSTVSGTLEAPTTLFAFLQELTLTVNNNVSPNKALGTLGAFEVTAGTFEVGGQMTAYFSDVAAIAAVRNNNDISLDFFIVKSNAGMAIDLPLLSLGDGRPAVEQDEPITLPLSMEAATGAKVDSAYDHTLLFSFFDYLPALADL